MRFRFIKCFCDKLKLVNPEVLFEQDRLTLMQAAELAEMRPIPFQHLLASRGISPHYDVPEFEQDMATLRQLGML